MKKYISFRLSVIILMCLVAACVKQPETSALPEDKNCLYYISRVAGAQGAYRDCLEGAPLLVFGGDGVMEFSLAKEADLAAFIVNDPAEGTTIWVSDRMGNNRETVYRCEDALCENLLLSPDGTTLYFSLGGRQPALKQLDLVDGDETSIVQAIVDFVDISPDGSFLRFHEPLSGLVRVLSIANRELKLSFPGDLDLIGGWSPEGSKFLMGARNVDGNLMVNGYVEVDVFKGEQTDLFTLPVAVEYFQPVYSGRDTFFVLARSGLKSSRQVWEIDRNGEALAAITEQGNYDHYGLRISSRSGSLVFQRYDTSRSDSVPEVAVWNREAQTLFLVSAHAVRPCWLD